ncbi:uncharacterized protein LOC123317538 [Coccinella septempunctata]|uniref:uncharacterized protein LOC123317538 n=1 Tax=Coccinella septempunctata TaxID=41139 RepID=UPI001D066631|nr:uncharacterized protein LOC123317538 [Coccinella septempunctata]XP_044760054.1 uncharacterized protein LOC123317538 [Coccinella septempunctata]
MRRDVSRSSNVSLDEENRNARAPVEATLSCLWVLTPLVATVSVLVVFLSMATNQWLHTEEKMNNPAYNGTGEKEFLSKFTISGLWTFCFTNPGEIFYHCNRIDYFSKERYSPDPADSALAIPYTVTRTVIFFIFASLLLSTAYVFSIMGQCVKNRTVYTFISGVVFTVAGLVMLLALIMYISVFKSEIGSKLRSRSHFQPAPFVYWYGYSFLLYIVGLISAQISGVASIFLFIYKMRLEWRYEIYNELRRGKKKAQRPNHFVHHERSVYYPCRRHPEAYINSNSAIHFPPIPQRRYFFSKEPVSDSPCSVHRIPHVRSRSNSVKDDLSSFYDFPPPPTISYQFDDTFNRDSFRRLPRDVTTNTVSTTADVNCDMMSERFEDFSPIVQHEREFVTFNLDQPLPLRSQSVVSISSKSDTLRRTTPV